MKSSVDSKTIPALDETIVEVQGLTHNYEERPALQNVSFAVRRGEIFGLLGPNGGGKTTLFRILSTLLTPSVGSASVFGLDILQDSHKVRQRIGVVFQSPSLDKKLTVTENLRHQGHLYGLRGKILQDRIGIMLARAGLGDRSNDLVEKLSGGLRRRVDLAKAFLHHPDLLLLDEPSAGLDPVARLDLWRYLALLRESDGVTILLTTHIMEEAECCDRLSILDRGKLVALGSPHTLKEAVGGDVVSVETKYPEKLRDQIRKKFGGYPAILDGTVRIETKSGTSGHEFIPQLAAEFPGQIDAVTVRKPTLEDVFIQRTGHRF